LVQQSLYGGERAVGACRGEKEKNSDDDNLPSVRKIIARSKSIISLTLGDDDDSTNDKNTIEVS